MPELAQVRLHGSEERDSLPRSILAPPAGFEPAHTAPECNPAYSRYQQKRVLRFMHGARMGRANHRPQLPAIRRTQQIAERRSLLLQRHRRLAGR